MKLTILAAILTACNAGLVKKDTSNGFSQGEPINYATGRGAPHSGQ